MGRISMFDDSAFVAFDHAKPLDENLIVRLLVDAQVEPSRPEWAVSHARRLLGSGGDISLQVGPHGGPDQTLVLTPLHGFVDAEEEEVLDAPGLVRGDESRATLLVSTIGFSLDDANGATVVIETVRRIRRILEAEYVFGGERHALTDPVDPRERAWPLMFLGDAMTKRVGETRISNTPAWLVEQEARGWWILASPTPFCRASVVAEPMALVAAHLGLR